MKFKDIKISLLSVVSKFVSCKLKYIRIVLRHEPHLVRSGSTVYIGVVKIKLTYNLN